MREIKFRGKQIDNGEWVFGSLLALTTGYYIVPTDTYYNKINIDLGEKTTINALWEHNDFYEVDPETVGQYTGLHDDSGEESEIFESDIVEFFYKGRPYVGVVKFEAGAFILVCEKLPDGYIALIDITQSDRDYFWTDGVVKGNEYENPELLKEGD